VEFLRSKANSPILLNDVPKKRVRFNGKYKKIRLLGEGSYGKVFKAAPVDSSQHTSVAIKKVKGIFNNKIYARRMLRELSLLRKLRACKNIVQILDILPPKNIKKFKSLCIVFEFVTTDLRKLLGTSQWWNEKDSTWILKQILLGVKFMHSAKICHRDLKPANILISKKNVRICDFGLARSWMANNDYKPSRWSKRRLSTGTTSGVTPVLWTVGQSKHTDCSDKDEIRRNPTRHVVTRWYRSPEVLLEQDWEHMWAIDMWSVGCIMADLMNMDEGNCSAVLMRKALFPGSSSSLSPCSGDDNVEVHNSGQLGTIIDVIGSPTEEEIEGFTKEEIKERLRKFGKKSGSGFNHRFPASSPNHVDLLKNLTTFDRRKRFTVHQALEHEALATIREPEKEQECEPEVCEFEGRDLSLRTLRKLIVDEVRLYNPDHVRQCEDELSISESKSSGSVLPNLHEMNEPKLDQDDLNTMEEDDSLMLPNRMSALPRSNETLTRRIKWASNSDSFVHDADQPQSFSPTNVSVEEEKNEQTAGEESNLTRRSSIRMTETEAGFH